jgi:hypothetical protein
MDIEKISHSGYRLSVVIAIVLSCMVVTLAALLGRGTLNLNGALILDQPTDVTVIALVEPKLDAGVTIRQIDFLRKEKRDVDTYQSYAYHVSTSDSGDYLVRIGHDATTNQWTLTQFETLHGETAHAE